jgi:hypothetical protein
MSADGWYAALACGWLRTAAAAAMAVGAAMVGPTAASAATGAAAVDAAELARAVDELANPGSSLGADEAAALYGEYVRRLTAVDEAVSRCDRFLDRYGGNQAVQQILRREQRKNPGDPFFTDPQAFADLQQAVGGAVDLSQQDVELCLRVLDQGAGGSVAAEPAALAAIGASVKKCLSSLSSVGPNAAGVVVLERIFRLPADDTFTSAQTLATLERAVGDLPLRPRELETCADAFDQQAGLERALVGDNPPPCTAGETACETGFMQTTCCSAGENCIRAVGRDSFSYCSSPGCFPATATVQLEDGSIKAMPDVRLGDRVLVARADGGLGYEDVYLNTHKDHAAAAPYVELTLASGRVLTLSPRHFIPVAGGPEQAWAEHVAKGADEVRAGDLVWSQAEDGRMVLDRVAAAETKVAVGAYNPLTLGGTIVVDGVVASAHSDWFLDGVVSADTEAKVYQAVLAPVRAAYRVIGPARMEAITEGWGVVDLVREATTPDGRGPGLGWVWLAAALFVGGGLLVLRRRRAAGH